MPASAVWRDTAVRLPLMAAVGGLVLVVFKQLWTPVGTVGHTIDWLLFVPLHAVAIVLIGRAAVSTRLSPRVARVWRLFQLSEGIMLVVLIATAALTALGNERGATIASNGAALALPPFLCGLLIFPVAKRRQWGMRSGQLLGVIVLSIGVGLGWLLATRPLLEAAKGGAIDLFGALWSPVGDLALLAALTVLLLRGTLPVHRSSLFVVVASQLVALCADLLTSQMTVQGTYVTTAPIDGAWFVATFLLGLAGAYQMVLERPDSAAPVATSLLTLKVFRATMYAGIVVAYAVILESVAPFFAVPLGGFLVATATLTGLLVVLPGVAFRDTERAMRDRRAQEARFAALVQQSPDLVMVVSPQCLLTYLTPSVGRALDRAPESLLGTNLLELVHSDDASAVRLALDYDNMSPRDETVRWRLRRADGSYVILDARLQDRCDDPLLEGFVVNARDVTTQLALEGQARHAQKMEVVGRLAGGIAHDFNNVLTVIRSSARLAMEQVTPGSALARELSEIDRATMGAAALTRRLLSFGRTPTMALVRLDLNLVVEEAEAMLRRLVAKEIDLKVRLLPDRVWMDGDTGSLEQVLLNLALNARDAMPRGGTLEVSVTRDDVRGQAGLVVRDSGAGMTAAVRARLFEPFFTTKEAGVGSGLGLATVAGIVRDMAGEIHVESEPDQGTTFTLNFPIREAGVITPSRSQAAVTGARGSERILVVDDDAAIRGSLEIFFGKLGYQVRVAGHGRQALRSLTEHGPADVILTDLVMPEMNGADLVVELRLMTPVPKIICMSGYAEHGANGENATRGLPFVQKPFSLDELAVTVRSVLTAAPG